MKIQPVTTISIMPNNPTTKPEENNTSFKAYAPRRVNIPQKTIDYEMIRFVLKSLAGLILGVGALTLGIERLTNFVDKKNLKNTIYTRATDIKSESGSEVTENELFTLDKAKTLFYENTKRFQSTHSRRWLDRFTKLDSDGGLEITKAEEDSFKYAMKNGLEVEEEPSVKRNNHRVPNAFNAGVQNAINHTILNN